MTRRDVMMRSKKSLGMILLVWSTFFSYGCTSAQRKELIGEAVESAKSYVVEKVVPEVLKKAEELADAKIKAEREKQYAVLDAQLAKLPIPKKDADGGEMVDEEGKKITVTKTWKDFDVAEPKGELDASELASLTGWIAKETARRVAMGEMSKDEAGRMAKNAGGAAVVLALLLGAGRLAKKASEGKKNNGSSSSSEGSA
jgi:hypothetical protein